MPEETAPKYLLVYTWHGTTEYDLHDTLRRAVDHATEMAAGEWGDRCHYYECWETDRFGCPRQKVADFDAQVREGLRETNSRGDHPAYPARPVVV